MGGRVDGSWMNEWMATGSVDRWTKWMDMWMDGLMNEWNIQREVKH